MTPHRRQNTQIRRNRAASTTPSGSWMLVPGRIRIWRGVSRFAWSDRSGRLRKSSHQIQRPGPPNLCVVSPSASFPSSSGQRSALSGQSVVARSLINDRQYQKG